MQFEDLDVWKKSAALCAEIYKDLAGLGDFGFKDQITRSALSIPSNIAEGFERSSNREILNFLNIAKGSAGELRAQIYIGIKIHYIEHRVGQKWIAETLEISKMLAGLRKYYRTNKS